MTDSELEGVCRRVLAAEENRFAVLLCHRGKSGMGRLVCQVIRATPKNKLTGDFYDRAFQAIRRLLEENPQGQGTDK